MAWIYLFIAGVLEVVWAYSMKQSHGFSQLVPSSLWRRDICSAGYKPSTSQASPSIGELLGQADASLLRAKGEVRNRVAS